MTRALLIAQPNAPGVALLAQSLRNLRTVFDEVYWTCSKHVTNGSECWQRLIRPLVSGEVPQADLFRLARPSSERSHWPPGTFDAVYLLGVPLVAAGRSALHNQAGRDDCLELLNQLARQGRVEHLAWQVDTRWHPLHLRLHPNLVLSYRECVWQCAAGSDWSGSSELAWFAGVCNRDSRLNLPDTLRDDLWQRSWVLRRGCSDGPQDLIDPLVQAGPEALEIDSEIGQLLDWEPRYRRLPNALFADLESNLDTVRIFPWLELEHIGELILRAAGKDSPFWAVVSGSTWREGRYKLVICGDWTRPRPALDLSRQLGHSFRCVLDRLAIAVTQKEEDHLQALSVGLRVLGIDRPEKDWPELLRHALRLPAPAARYLKLLATRRDEVRRVYHQLHNEAMFPDCAASALTKLRAQTASLLSELGELPPALAQAGGLERFHGTLRDQATGSSDCNEAGRNHFLVRLRQLFSWERGRDSLRTLLEELCQDRARLRFQTGIEQRPVFARNWVELAVQTWLENARKYAPGPMPIVECSRLSEELAILLCHDFGAEAIPDPQAFLRARSGRNDSTGIGLRGLINTLAQFDLELRVRTPDYVYSATADIRIGGDPLRHRVTASNLPAPYALYHPRGDWDYPDLPEGELPSRLYGVEFSIHFPLV